MSPSVEPSDRGFLLGDGLFETVLWRDGRLVMFEAHAARLGAGCDALGLPAPDPDDLRRAAEAAVRAADLDRSRAAVRLTWTAGPGGRGLDRPQTMRPGLIATAAPSPAMQTPAALAPAALATVGVRRNEGSPTSRLKTLAYLDNVLARAEARAAGADEALMLNNRGELACAAAANLFWVRDGVLFTPALSCGVLDGIVRAAVMAAAPVLGLAAAEVAASRSTLDSAEAVFLTNSLIGVREVGLLDGAAVPRSAVTAQLREALADVV
jgi:branched-subunit amino acid aminotransferase/4-amino-4-deoxychorismate lyase